MNNQDKYDIIGQKILARLGDDVGKWQASWHSLGQARNLDGKLYSGRNRYLGLLGATPIFGTYKALKAKDLQVNKGAKALPILYWNFVDTVDKLTGEPKTIPFLKYYSVFSIDDCEGDKSQFELPELKTNVESRIESIDQWASALNVPIDGASYPHYLPDSHRVGMPSFELFKSANDYYSVLFHELVHSTGNELKRDMSGKFGGAKYAFEELVAESGSAILMAENGLSASVRDDHVQYIKSWIKCLKDDPKLFLEAFKLAGNATDHLLGVSTKELAKVA